MWIALAIRIRIRKNSNNFLILTTLLISICVISEFNFFYKITITPLLIYTSISISSFKPLSDLFIHPSILFVNVNLIKISSIRTIRNHHFYFFNFKISRNPKISIQIQIFLKPFFKFKINPSSNFDSNSKNYDSDLNIFLSLLDWEK